MNSSTSFALFLALAAPVIGLASCSSPGVAFSGAGGSTSAESSSSESVGGFTSASSSSGAEPMICPGAIPLPANDPCTPSAACMAKIDQCLPLHDNADAPAFGLRMAGLTFTAPASLTKGLINSVIANSMTLNQPACNLNGAGTFSWLLAFDTVAGTLKTGGAMPAADPALGYSFVDQDYPVLGGKLHVGPVTLTAPLDPGCQASSSAADLNLPIYLDQGASDQMLIPLRQARFVKLSISGHHNCIGKYNAKGLDPSTGCVADDQNPIFLPGGQIVGLINLDQADSVIIDALGQSLCVVLSGDAATYGNGGTPARCKRTGGKIVFKGDWCTATNAAASAGCSDAVNFAGDFAASGVLIE